MRKPRKKNVLDKLDDAIYDKMSERKANKKNKNKKKIYDYEEEVTKENYDDIITEEIEESENDIEESEKFSFDMLDKDKEEEEKETKKEDFDDEEEITHEDDDHFDFDDNERKEKEDEERFDFDDDDRKEKEDEDRFDFDDDEKVDDAEIKEDIPEEKPKKKLFGFGKKKEEKTSKDEDIPLDEVDEDIEVDKKEKQPKKKLFSFKKKDTPKDDEDKQEDETAEMDIVPISKKEKKKLFNSKKHDKKGITIIDEDNDTEDNHEKKNKKGFFAFNKKKDHEIIPDDNDELDIKDDDDMKKKNKKHKNNKNYKNSKKNKYKETKKKRSFWKKLVTFVLIMGIIGILSVAAFLGYIVATAPEFNDSALLIKDQTVIYDIDGNVIAKLGSEKRESVTYDALPQVLIDAIIATEDSRFFQHNGVDLFRFIKATIQQMLGHDDAGGASTLTMQTVKNNITKKDSTENSSTIQGKIKKVVRKFQDVYIAVFKVEKKYSKEEILEMYVNDNFLGGSYYGVEEASKYYFGKSVSDLTLPEASLIAGLFQAPGRHNPYIDIDKATARRTTVLKLMLRHGYITEEEKEIAESIPIKDLLVGRNNEDTKYQGYIDTVVAEVERLTDRGDGTGGDNPYTVPMKIYTTMETKIQDGINSIFSSTAKYIWKDYKVQGGVAVVNSETGAIAAVGAGRNKTGERQFNYATQAYRQPGSTAKPLFDYGPAIEYLNYSTATLVLDEPWSYTNGPAVSNWDNGYKGLQTIRYHLQVSRNVPALKTFQAVGAKNSQKFASALGLDVSLNTESENYHVFDNGLDNTINEAYSIGGAAKGFTPLEMATAYACFSNGGFYIEPHTVTKIVYRETNEEKEFKYAKERVMKDSTAYIMNNILESAVSGGGFDGGARVAGSHVAAKTGTSNYDQATMRKYGLPGGAVNDLWTVAYTSKYSVAVWYGYDEVDSKYYNDSGTFKDALTTEVMAYVPKDPVGWSQPSSVVVATVENETAPLALPSEFTPNDMKTTGYFVKGTQPTEVSPRYQKFSAINADTIKTTNNSNNSVTITWDYKTPTVLTDDYIQKYFSDRTFGNQKGGYASARKSYNQNTLGGFGYGIYKKEADGKLTRLDWVTTNSYTYSGYGQATLVIKAEYGKWKNNASEGVNVNVTLEDLKPSNLKVTLNNTNTQFNVGEYTEDGISKITYDSVDITTSNSVTIRYLITTQGTVNNFNTATELEEFINTLEAGNYTITYDVKYLSIETSVKRTISLK